MSRQISSPLAGDDRLVFAHNFTISLVGNCLKIAISKVDRPVGGGKRGGVGEWSRQSRYRLMNLLNSIVFETVQFITLTFHENVIDAVYGKKCLARFLRGLKLRYGAKAGIWRQERQQRGAIHYHVMILDCPKLDAGWVASYWNISAGEDPADDDHLRYGSRVERVILAGSKDGGLIVSYFAKYIAKNEGENDYENGRVWGQWGCQKFIPAMQKTDIPLALASIAFRWVASAGGCVYDNPSVMGGSVYLGHIGKSAKLDSDDTLIELLYRVASTRAQTKTERRLADRSHAGNV